MSCPACGAAFCYCDQEEEARPDGRIHVMPYGPGERPHEESLACFCGPAVDVVEPRLVIHNRVATA